MDYVVHINNGSEAAKPIVLRLLPGEETIFNLRIVNHGEPSNISLEPNDPVIKAVRLKRPDHYVVLEETVPVLARMPTNRKRLDGELLLTSDTGKSSVPITLFRDTEDSIDQEYDPDEVDSLDDDDLIPVRERDDEDEDPESDAFEMDEDHLEAEREPEEFDDVEHIKFTRKRDLHSYKSASRPASRFSSGPRSASEGMEDEAGIERGFGEERVSRYHQEDLQESRQYGEGNPGHESNRYAGELGPYQDEDDDADETEDNGRGTALGLFGGGGSLQIIPGVILVTLIAVLILTFFTESLPEFPGALASSILIVTLIIYGAATLLKA